MKNIIEALREANIDLPVIIGGAPVTQDYADSIGAAGYAPDSGTAVDIVEAILAS